MTQADIIDIENKLIEGIKNSNVSLRDRLLHDDLLFMAPNGQTVTKAMDLASHRAGQMVVERLEATVEEIKMIDDNAVVVVVYDTQGKMLGNSIQVKFRYIRVWKQFAEGLKVIGGSCFQL